MSEETVRLTHPLARDVTVPNAEVWTFPEGLLGLADHRRFALVPLPSAAPLELLCSAGESGFGIVLVDPALWVPDYSLELAAADLAVLEELDPERVQIRVPVRLPTKESPLSLNLKGPILLAPGKRIGAQRISPDEAHPIRFTPSFADIDPASCSS